jgi:thiol-disulfide isomerase/thioredoxin
MLSVGLMAILVGSGAALASAQAPAAPATAPAAPAAAAPAAPAAPVKVQAPAKQEMAQVAEGAAVPDVKLPFAFENKMASLKDLVSKGKPVTLVSFVNTACASCVGEIKLLQDLEAKSPGKLSLVLIVTDRTADRAASTFGGKEKMTYLLDPNFSAPPVFGFKSTPALVVIKDGKIKKLVTGFVPSEEGATELTALIEAGIK